MVYGALTNRPPSFCGQRENICSSCDFVCGFRKIVFKNSNTQHRNDGDNVSGRRQMLPNQSGGTLTYTLLLLQEGVLNEVREQRASLIS